MPEVDPAAREPVERAHLLGHVDRVALGEQHHGRAQANTRRARRQEGQGHERLEQPAPGRGRDPPVLGIGVAAGVVTEEHHVLTHPDGADVRVPRRQRLRRRATPPSSSGWPSASTGRTSRHTPSPRYTKRTDLVGGLWGWGWVGLPGPHRERPVDLLADQHHGPLGVEVGRKSPAATPATTSCSSTRVMSSPISMRAPPTAADPSAPVPCVAMARRKKAGLSSIALEQPEDEGAEALSRRAPWFVGQRHGVLEPVVHGLHAGPQQLVAVGEVHVERRAGHPRLGGDLVHGRRRWCPARRKAAGRRR